MTAVQFEQVDATTIGITKKGIRLLKLYMSGMGEPSTHEFVLPAEIWHQVIDLLVVDDIWSAARCQLINKEMHDIVLSDLTWRNVYEDWTQTQTDPTMTHWYDRFVKEGMYIDVLLAKYNLADNSFQLCGREKSFCLQM
jgi:hypothetical protein